MGVKVRITHSEVLTPPQMVPKNPSQKGHTCGGISSIAPLASLTLTPIPPKSPDRSLPPSSMSPTPSHRRRKPITPYAERRARGSSSLCATEQDSYQPTKHVHKAPYNPSYPIEIRNRIRTSFESVNFHQR